MSCIHCDYRGTERNTAPEAAVLIARVGLPHTPLGESLNMRLTIDTIPCPCGPTDDSLLGVYIYKPPEFMETDPGRCCVELC